MVTIDKALSRRLQGRRFREMSREITAAQEKLRKAVSRRAWRAYLDLEQLVGARQDAMLGTAIRLALRRGRQALLLDLVRHLEVD
jgi:hypothetical protein